MRSGGRGDKGEKGRVLLSEEVQSTGRHIDVSHEGFGSLGICHCQKVAGCSKSRSVAPFSWLPEVLISQSLSSS